MNTSIQIAGLLGPVLMAVAFTEFLHFRMLEKITAPVVYLNGLLLFTGGLAIIRVHNLWQLDWVVLITLIGWLACLLGLYRMVFPAGKQLKQNLLSTIGLLVLFLIGTYLTVKAYI